MFYYNFASATIMSLAQFADASFAYPGTDILAGASLLIRPGDRLALLAPNGVASVGAASSKKHERSCAT